MLTGDALLMLGIMLLAIGTAGALLLLALLTEGIDR